MMKLEHASISRKTRNNYTLRIRKSLWTYIISVVSCLREHQVAGFTHLQPCPPGERWRLTEDLDEASMCETKTTPGSPTHLPSPWTGANARGRFCHPELSNLFTTIAFQLWTTDWAWQTDLKIDMASDRELKSMVPQHIEVWLENVNTARSDAITTNDSKSEPSAETKDSGPVTPQKPFKARLQVEDVSPTDTCFSSTSIFDSPLISKGRFRERIGSRDTADDESDITSVNGDEASLSERVKTGDRNDLDTAQSRQQPPQLLSEVRKVRLTSCLQCTLAKLPCSCAPPACSRCKRNGHGEICLLQRYKFLDERKPSSRVIDFRVPVLLQLATDDQDEHDKKVRLAEALLEKWREDQDKKNWVLPDMHVRRGSYSVIVPAARDRHPGEGSAKGTYVELNVKLEWKN